MDGLRGPTTRHRNRLLTGFAAGVVALAGALDGCGTQHPTIAELQAIPGATSAYPGSLAVFGRGAREGEHTLVNSSGAELFATWCTQAERSEVTQWFGAELQRHGWEIEPNPVGTTSTDVSATERWSRGEREFTVEILGPAYLARLSASQGRPCPFGYRTDVQ